MSATIELVAGSHQRIRDLLGLLEEPFDRARRTCEERLGATGVAVHVVDAPDDCIPEWGLGGVTCGPHSVVLSVDPDHAIQPAHVFSTLVHEIHHAVRWRGPGCGSSLRDRLVSEGLAQVFEEECTGGAPLYAEGDVSLAQRDLVLGSLAQDPADDARWFFGSADLPRWLGYRVGFQVVRARVAALGSTAADLVSEPSATFL